MLGSERTILPGFVARRTVSVALLKKSAPRLAAVLAWIESLLRPRLDFMSTPRAERLIGILCVLLAILTTLPIPFGHQLPALAVVLIGLGLIERDGLAMLAGVVLGAVGLAALVMLVLGIVHGAHHLLHIHSLRYWLRHLL
jgi:hypothetical protein